MSLSQKHSGLILVPWFNSEEWRHVYRLIYSYDKEKQVQALDLLKIWKMRTPILSTGVEGTLILLEVLILDSESLPDEQITNLYAVALMRFLNLSAANSERQGSFTKTSVKNELPKWLTNLRHDIAHGLHIPSKYNLKMGLDFGFNWLKEKYWDQQSKIITDYYIHNEPKLDTLAESLEVYLNINVNLFEMVDLDNEFYEQIKNMINKKFKRKNLHPYLMLDIFLEMIAQCLETDHSVRNVDKCLDILVSREAFLKPNFDEVSEDESNVKLNRKFVNIWTNLLNLLHRNRMLLSLVDRLFYVIGSIIHTKYSKKMASLWINEIFLALQNLRDSDTENEDTMPLEKNKYTYTEESLEFQNKVLYFFNEDSSQYTVDFLDNLLKYTLSNDRFSSEALMLSNVNAALENLHKAENKIYTLEDLKVENLNVEDVPIAKSDGGNKISEYSAANGEQIVGTIKWKKIEDSSVFRNCPLGVMPHQINRKHPFLILG